MNIQKKIKRIIRSIIFSALPSLFLLPGIGFAAPQHSQLEGDETFAEKINVICVTIPKTGTHLLIKCLSLLDIDGITYNYNVVKEYKKRFKRRYKKINIQEYADRALSRLKWRIKDNENSLKSSYLVHLPSNLEHSSVFNKSAITKFLMIRDPRDQLISLASTSLKDPTNREIGLQETLLDLLQGTENQIPWAGRHGACDLVWSIGIVNFYNAFLEWNKTLDFCMIRYENLVGPKGGGDETIQINEIKKIGRHLGVELSEEQIQRVIDNLYGESRTFKKGQSKSWKQYFTPEVVTAFKQVPGACELLIDLGYETDCNW